MSSLSECTYCVTRNIHVAIVNLEITMVMRLSQLCHTILRIHTNTTDYCSPPYVYTNWYGRIHEKLHMHSYGEYKLTVAPPLYVMWVFFLFTYVYYQLQWGRSPASMLRRFSKSGWSRDGESKVLAAWRAPPSATVTVTTTATATIIIITVTTID